MRSYLFRMFQHPKEKEVPLRNISDIEKREAERREELRHFDFYSSVKTFVQLLIPGDRKMQISVLLNVIKFINLEDLNEGE